MGSSSRPRRRGKKTKRTVSKRQLRPKGPSTVCHCRCIHIYTYVGKDKARQGIGNRGRGLSVPGLTSSPLRSLSNTSFLFLPFDSFHAKSMFILAYLSGKLYVGLFDSALRVHKAPYRVKDVVVVLAQCLSGSTNKRYEGASKIKYAND